ncbi:MAG: hypothetical protein ACI841_003574 [Planctomycetota bacterium]|jgi:hypothetical protein
MKETDSKPSTPPAPDDNKSVREEAEGEAKEPNKDYGEEGTEREHAPKPRKYPKPLR